MERIRVVTSGYINPLHVGHLNLILEASRLGNELVFIVNNDKQVKLKGSIPFMGEHDRWDIVNHIKGVDYAVVAIDEDETVCETLRLLRPAIFAKGGDRNEMTMDEREKRVCEEIGCEIVYGVGGSHKAESSSSLLQKVIDYDKARILNK